jgi:hypothetical protein
VVEREGDDKLVELWTDNSVRIKEKYKGGTCSTHGGEEKCILSAGEYESQLVMGVHVACEMDGFCQSEQKLASQEGLRCMKAVQFGRLDSIQLQLQFLQCRAELDKGSDTLQVKEKRTRRETCVTAVALITEHDGKCVTAVALITEHEGERV